MEIFTIIGMFVVLLAAIYFAGKVLDAIGEFVSSRFDDLMERRRRASLTDDVIAKAVHVAYKNDPFGVFFQHSYTIKKGKRQEEYWGFYDHQGDLHSFKSEDDARKAANAAGQASGQRR